MPVLISPRPRPFAGLVAVLGAVAAAVAIAACGGSSGGSAAHASGKVNGKTVTDLYGSLPTPGTPTGAGTITMGQLTGDTPTYLFPIVPGADATDGTAFMIDQLYVPLYNEQVGGVLKVNYQTSGALPPTFSDGGQRVTIRLRPGLRWSNGKPVTSADVLFDLALLRSAVREGSSNWELYSPGLMPDNVKTATAPNPSTVVLTFTRKYNPSYLLGDELAGTLIPLPSSEWDIDAANGPHLNWRSPAVAKKIYDYLSHQGKTLSTFASNPLWKTVDGPFELHSFSTTNSSFTLAANPRYTLTGKVRYSTLGVQTYTSTFAQLNALQAGDLDVAAIDFSQLGQVGSLRADGYSVYGYPNIGSFGAILNFKDTAGDFDKIIAQLYVRQALDHLINQPAYISGIFKGAAAPAYSPLPTVPKTPYTPTAAGTATYPYSISTAAKLLRSHGWKVVPGGQTTCARAGAGPGECGAGIPSGTPLKVSWWATPAASSPSVSLESQAFASAAKQVGVNIQLGTKTFNYQISNFDDADPADSTYRNDWAVANWGEYGTSPYPTGDVIFNTGGAQNLGGYSNPTTDKLIAAAIYGNAPDAATKVNAYLAKDLPILFLPCADVIDAVSNNVGGTSDSFLAMTQDVFYPQYWYVKKHT